MSESDKGGDFIDNVKRADAVVNAKAKARRRTRKGAQPPRTATNTSSTGGSGGYAAQALSREIENVQRAPTGARNDTMNTALFNLGQLIGAGELDRTMVEDSMRLAARLSGLPDKEIDLLLRRDDGPVSRGMERPRDMSDKGRRSAATDYTSPPPPPPVIDVVEDIEDGFWDSRESLQRIYIGALSRLSSPWAVLAVCVARALATVRPQITLPDLIGGPGSLNWFGAITAASGGGKGAASATARMLVTDTVLQRNTGSGEGMIGAFVRPAADDEPRGLHESVMFNVDEIDSLTAQSSRSGATTMSVLRSAFSGETLGFSYVNKNTPTLEAHTYRMTMIVSVQPQRAAGLLADHAGGTPQRFMWFPGADKRVDSDLAGGWVTPLDLPRAGEWLYPRVIEVPRVCSEEILRERVRSMRGLSDDPLAGHSLFVREKFAFALALLDGRTGMTVEDWELSGVAARVSDATRYWIGNLAEEAEIAERVKLGEYQAISSLASDEKKANVVAEKRGAVAQLVLKYLKTAGLEGLTKRDIQRRLARNGTMFPSVAEGLQAEGMIRFDRNRWYII